MLYGAASVCSLVEARGCQASAAAATQPRPALPRAWPHLGTYSAARRAPSIARPHAHASWYQYANLDVLIKRCARILLRASGLKRWTASREAET
eukprot:5666400-Pleurochrysis_carterae.AAC.1